MLICPICKEKLNKDDRKYFCLNNHCFDISKSSHANLLISNKSGDRIGDNKEMVRARTAFLEKDFYKPLSTKITQCIKKQKNISYLDCGCGQGYYTKIVSENLKNSKSFATDISKNAIIHASKQDKKTVYFVGSVFDLPILDKSINLITCIFSPVAEEEFARVLKDDGELIVVVAGDEHLYELKKAVYSSAYKNNENKYNFNKFCVLKKEKLTYKTNVISTQDIKNLFYMTPYALKTSREDKEKLEKLHNLEVTFDFVIYTLKKKNFD